MATRPRSKRVTRYVEMRPSEVFAMRLAETRKARGLSQAKLAQALSDRGHRMSKASLLRLENGDRTVSLDEALALAQVLGAVPEQLLSPPEGALVFVTAKEGYDGSGVRSWLRTGYFAAEAEDRRKIADAPEKEIAHHAQAYLDALRGKDAAGKRDALEALVRATHRREKGNRDGD